MHRISATGTEIGASLPLQSPGTVSVKTRRSRCPVRTCYVAWIQGLVLDAGEARGGGHQLRRRPDVQAGRDGRTAHHAAGAPATSRWRPTATTCSSRSSTTRTASGPPAAATAAAPSRAWRRSPVPGDRVDGGADYDAGRRRGHASSGPGCPSTTLDIWTRRSTDAGRTLEPPAMVYRQPRRTGTTRACRGSRAEDGVVAIVYQQGVPDAAPGPHGHGLRLGARGPDVQQRAARAGLMRHLGGEATRCVGDYCVSTYTVDIDGRAHLCRLAGEGHHVARAVRRRRRLRRLTRDRSVSVMRSSSARRLGPGRHVVATWYTRRRVPGSWDIERRRRAFSSDHGQSFHDDARSPRASQRDLYPVATAWGPDPPGAGFAWWSWDDNYYSGRHPREVRPDERGRSPTSR